MTTLLPCTPDGISQAAELLREGGLVAFPTETVYGLGANALDPQAVARIFAAKGRPANNPLIVHIFEPAQAWKLALPSQEQQLLLEKLSCFWPGPLSLVLPARSIVPREVTAGQDSVALRMPDHPIALALLRAAGVPIAAPSANPSNYISPTSAQQVVQQLDGKVDAVLDGGACSVGLESTVLSLLEPEPVLLRPGAITLEQLSLVLGPMRFSTHASLPLSPGMLPIHYAPRSKLILRAQLTESPCNPYSLVLFKEIDRQHPLIAQAAKVSLLSKDGNLSEIAHKLFATLYEHDQLGLGSIVCDTCPEQGLGMAIMDRLRRAAASNSTK